MTDLFHIQGLRLARRDSGGAFEVLRDLSLRLEPTERLALLGGNGSGKSSLLRHLATPGVLPNVKAGLVFQDPEEQFVADSVAGELLLGRPGLQVEPVLEEFGLHGRAGDDPRLLSAGQKQRLQLAVVMSGSPDLLLLDEPTSLQDVEQTAWLRERLHAWPRAMIWATQKVEEVQLCGRALVLDGGRPLACGPTEEVLAKPEVASLLVPDHGTATRAWSSIGPLSKSVQGSADPVAELVGVACRFLDGNGFAGVDLSLTPGDRIGITGLNGCGKSTLLAIMAGLRKPDLGRVRLFANDLYERSALDLDHGLVALAPQFPEYLFCRGDLAAEIRLDPGLRGISPEDFLAAMDMPVNLVRRNPHDLSGGQKRRLALALALHAGRPLILLDEPTAALDASGRAMVARMVRAADHRAALVIASHDPAFLAACGCRVLRLDGQGFSTQA